MNKFSFGKLLVPVVGTIALIYLLLPIAHVILFSFNQKRGRNNIIWNGFSLANWQNPCGAPQVCTAFGNSILVGVVATVIATVLGTMITSSSAPMNTIEASTFACAGTPLSAET